MPEMPDSAAPDRPHTPAPWPAPAPSSSRVADPQATPDKQVPGTFPAIPSQSPFVAILLCDSNDRRGKERATMTLHSRSTGARRSLANPRCYSLFVALATASMAGGPACSSNAAKSRSLSDAATGPAPGGGTASVGGVSSCI